ncbi:transmembrane protein 237-like [Elysia marginata]|uniref:Transmembrane protein 237-like n=1 Tax=Elysia marginata TaxID=1093978 RepID=A0AAV4FBH6_9GAST|nr:transmembrane protein 237-like [Elysia marginata]
MADETKEAPKRVTKKKGLPPLSPKGEDGETVKPAKKRVKKKPVDENTPPDSNTTKEGSGNQEKPTPRRRRKRSPSQTKGEDADVEPPTETAPRKKKKKPKTQAPGESQDQNTNRTQEKDAQGSKTSLISKEGGTPRKKVAKKKKKVKKEAPEDEFGDSPWAEDLKTLEEDIITGDGQDEAAEEEEETEEASATQKPEGTKKAPLTFLTAPILRSQPLDKIFIETSNRFKGQTKSALERQRQEEMTRVPDITPAEIPRATTIDFAIGSHKIFRVISLFLHGLTAGLLLWQMIIVFALTSSSFSDDDFLEHYYRLSMPLQASMYFLLALGTVSACDRFDVGNPTRRFVLRALTMQNGAVAIVFSLAALVINIILIKYDDKMYLYKDIEDIFSDASVS